MSFLLGPCLYDPSSQKLDTILNETKFSEEFDYLLATLSLLSAILSIATIVIIRRCRSTPDSPITIPSNPIFYRLPRQLEPMGTNSLPPIQ